MRAEVRYVDDEDTWAVMVWHAEDEPFWQDVCYSYEEENARWIAGALTRDGLGLNDVSYDDLQADRNGEGG